MAWYRCEAHETERAGADVAFAVTRFVQAEAEPAARRSARALIGRELVRRGVDPLDAEAMVAVGSVERIDEDDVPGIAPDMVWAPRG